MPLPAALPYQISLALGSLLSQTPLNTIRKTDRDGAAIYEKKRKWYAGLLVFAGNLLLAACRANVSALYAADARIWQSRVLEGICGAEILKSEKGWQAERALDGAPLSAILASRDYGMQRKMDALGICARSLADIHQKRIRRLDGIDQSFSHGDATAKNVICNLARNCAVWIDFEMVHDGNQTNSWRHADDLRALISSSAFYLDETCWPALCHKARESYACDEVWEEMLRQISHVQYGPMIYRLAQAPLSRRKYMQMTQLLVRQAATEYKMENEKCKM
ncbi:MAG: hypothetical protein NTX50_21195 [Candidatus Sumerlaeota bacterium]|nr:hypothetical protein [Candidatus Sumerlaeota bacterium]